MKKVITFALWGHNPKYAAGAVENAKLAKQLFTNWECRFYVNGVTDNLVDRLNGFSATVVQMPSGPWQKHGRRAGDAQPDDSMFWKINTYFDKSVDIFFARDVDSRLSLREKMAIDEFVQSDKQFHIIRDHPADCAATPILGAMWGIKTSLKLDMKAYIKEFKKTAQKCVDQIFLKQYLYPRVKDYALIHHDESCAAGCQLDNSHPDFWNDGKLAEHRPLAPRNWFKFSNCIGIDYHPDNRVVEQSQKWLDDWYATGRYWWKK